MPTHRTAAGRAARYRDARLLLFNKPFGVLSQFTDVEGRSTLADFITCPGFYAAGRLDRDSEGLLVLTAEGRLQHRLSDPRYKLSKRYVVQVEGTPGLAALERLRRGVRLKDGLTLPARCEPIAPPTWLWSRDPPIRQRARIATSWLALELREGRNRQLRRMTAAVGLPALRLIRTAVGPYRLGGLAPGEWRLVQTDD